MSAWLRLALWDDAAADYLAIAGRRGSTTSQSCVARSSQLLSLSSTAHMGEAACASLVDRHVPQAYLAALLSQPASSTYADLEAELHSVSAVYLPRPLRALFALLAGSDLQGSMATKVAGQKFTPDCAEGAMSSRQPPAGWPDGAWMHDYVHALRAHARLLSCDALPPPAALSATHASTDKDADRRELPIDTAWHILRSRRGGDPFPLRALTISGAYLGAAAPAS